MDSLTTFFNEFAFPVAMVIVLMIYILKLHKDHRDDIDKISTKNESRWNTFNDSVQENTKALSLNTKSFDNLADNVKKMIELLYRTTK